MSFPCWRVFRLAPMSTIQQSVATCLTELNPGKSGTRILPIYPPQLFSATSSFCMFDRYFGIRNITDAYFRYYRLFMYYYAISLRTASFVMVNSSWTKGHVDSILQYSDLLLDGLHLLPPLVFIKLFTARNAPSTARIVYPPCDTREMAAFPLIPRQRIILSVAQFRFGLSFLFYLQT